MTRLILFLLVGVLTGCQTASYYQQAIQGQSQILRHRKPLDKLIADPQTPADQKDKFHLVLQLRKFARAELKLPVNGHYRTYVDLHRRFVVWNVHASPEFSLQPKTWWYPVVGSLKYRGYFSEAEAERYAARMAGRGFDTYVDGVEAYSTLGCFTDPVLNTFINRREPELAEIIFHELAHQRVFIHGDTDFNEAFATTVGQEGVRRWLLASGDAAASEKYQVALQRNEQFVQLIQATRCELDALYAQNNSCHPTNRCPPVIELLQAKALVFERLRSSFKQLEGEHEGFKGYDHWFDQPLNNAKLNTVVTYYDLVPGFQKLLMENRGDLETFYREVRSLGKRQKSERDQRLLPNHNQP